MPLAPPPMPPRKPHSAKPAAPAPPKAEARKAKTFSVAPWTGSGQGEKVVGYGTSGSGKTTLFSMMPGAVFLGLDDGGRKIRDPRTGQPIQHVEGVETFEDVRDALHQTNLFPTGSSCVIDTLTILELWAEPYMFAHIPHEKAGIRVERLEDYGYGKGYTHLFDTMRLILQDLDGIIRRGVNVGLICQIMAIKKANPGGTDYLYEGPKLSHPTSEKEKHSVRLHVCEWADHVFKIDYHDIRIEAGRNEKLGKAKGETTRAVYVRPEPHFYAKSRTIQEPVISFAEASDDSLWTFLFSEKQHD